MSSPEANQRIDAYRKEITELREKIRSLQSDRAPEPVEDYEFATSGDGSVRLSELFGDKDTLIVIHNMGASCPSCTLWADGFNGVIDHLEDRAAFVVSSPDTPDQQKKFAASRNWRFRMVSHANTSFAEDLGYKGKNGWWPGVSVFKKSDDGVVRVADTSFGPGDDFCIIWHLMDMIPEGAAGWEPKYIY